MELRNTLISSFGVELPATAILDYPTIDALAGHIATLVAPAPLVTSGAHTPARHIRMQHSWSPLCRRFMWHLLQSGAAQPDIVRTILRALLIIVWAGQHTCCS